MIPLLYDKTGNVKIGDLNDCISCLVEEERNGLFEVTLEYPSDSPFLDNLVEENIIVCDANDTLKSQKFRIYMTRKLMSNIVEVCARHISFDLAYDIVKSINIENQSCEYALNQIFRQSEFSTSYRGYSDIVNAQNYKIDKVNCLEAIAGKKGSIIDTFGTGAEILRDNTNIHVLNKRGHDNSVSIEYAKNLTGLEVEEDTSELITRIIPYAKYTPSVEGGTGEEVLIEAGAVDSPNLAKYAHPYVSYIDYSDKFENGEEVTKDKLAKFAQVEYKDNKVDIPKQNFKIEFIPLSKCVGYEGLEDRISLCDIVTIKDTRYNISTQAKVIRAVFNVLKCRYESIELGEPRTSLGDIVGGGSGEDGKPGPPGPQGPPGADGNIGDFPNSLPSIPVLASKLYGFANIELSWTFENKVYYQYELYASKTKDFTPNAFDIIHQGQTSSFLFQAKPNETWYFKACAINSHGGRTDFSNQVVVTTKKVNDLSNYVENLAIGEALIGTLSLDRGWIGQLDANLLDVKGNFSVTDGNGKRTLDIDSFGNIYGDFTSLSFNNIGVEESIVNKGNMVSNSNVLYTIEGFEPIGGTIKRYENIKEEEKPSDIPTSDDSTVDGSTNKPNDLPNGGSIGEIIETPTITPPSPPPVTGINRTRVHFLLTASCGDCILIQTDTGENILIDGVDDRLYNPSANDATTPIIKYLEDIGITKLDYVICTHFHSDHAGALPFIMNRFCDKTSKFIYKPVTTQIRTNADEVRWKTEQYYNNCISACDSKNISKLTMTSGNKTVIDNNTDFTVYHKSIDNYNNYNDHSLMIVFRYKNKKIAFMGDATPTVQYEFKDLIGKVDIVKDSHHGYNSKADIDFVKVSNPRDVIVTRNYPFDTGYYRACNSVGTWQSYNKSIYATFYSKNHIIIDFINNDYKINTTKKFYFENCWNKWNNDSNKWVYFKSGGKYAVSETLVLEGKKYNFDSYGFCTNPYNPQ